MAADVKEVERLAEKRDILRVVVLLGVASVIGIYLIVTTVLVAGDGILYLQQAQKFATDPDSVIHMRLFPPGYPFLIFIAHKIVALFGGSSSAFSWIYCGQSVTLLCRVLAIVPLYFIGKLWVGSTRSFLAILILILLPYPAQFGSDIIRDWPHILFLAWGMLFLIQGANKGKWQLFGYAGVVAGLGYMIRPECAQILIYGILWLAFGLLRPERHKMSRSKLLGTMLILLLGFIVTAGPYMKTFGLPPKLKEVITPVYQLVSQKVQDVDTSNGNCMYAAAGLPANVAGAVGKLINEITISLFYFFMPALWIGLYFRFRRESTATDVEKFFLLIFAGLNMGILVVQFCFWQALSTRYCLPLVVLLVFYVPAGLQVLGDWLDRRFRGGKEAGQSSRKWFFVLLATGLIICLCKLVGPIRADKQYYRDTAKWLAENTNANDRIAVPDIRISFYAGRTGLRYRENIPEQTEYIVTILKDKKESLPQNENVWIERFSVTGDDKESTTITVYERKN